MHELGIIVHITKTLQNVAKENNLSEIEILPATTYCEDCRQTYPTVEFGRQCPYCKSPNTYLVCGDECNIKEIEAQ